MFNVEDILARLNKGESIETIAAEATAALNKANDAYTAANAAAAEEEFRKTALTEAADNLVSSLLEYIALVYPEAIEDVTEEDVEELVGLLVNEADSLKEIAAMCAAFGDMKVAFAKPSGTCMAGCSCHRETPKKEVPKEVEKAAEDVIAEFLRKNFLS